MNEASRKTATTISIPVSNIGSTNKLASLLARQCRSEDCILLRGGLGVGKTSFARGFIEALCPDCGEIVSPTFTILQAYRSKNGIPIGHFDFYRIEKQEELMEVGWEDALQSGITLIEWPEIAQSRLPKEALDITIELGQHQEQRLFTLSGLSEIWQSRLQSIMEEMNA